jgi:hypothetical protein
MTIDESLITPRRMTLVNLDNAETKEVMFNPDELEESFQVNWTRRQVPGLPHEPLQYSNTGNLTTTLNLYCISRDEDQVESDDFKRFIISLGYPRSTADSIATGAPPRVLLIWPQHLSIQCVVNGNVSFKTTAFSIDGRALRWSASVPFEEIRDFRLTSEDARRLGHRRPPSGGFV